MSLTYREEKGSALTIEELDNNFRYFTGSHSITGSLTISGSVIPAEENATLGTEANPWKELYVSSNSIKFISGSTTASISMNSSGGIDTPVETASYADFAASSSYATTSSYALNFNPSATASYAVNALSASYAPNIYNSDDTLIDNRTVTLGGNDLIFDASQGEKFHISSSELSEVLISNLPSQTREYVVGYNPADGALYAMPTSSIAGSGSGSAFPFTGSAAISGSLTVDGKILNDFPQVDLYPTGTGSEDAIELQLGVVNIIHDTNGAIGTVKLPDPVYGRIVRVVGANSTSSPFNTSIIIYTSTVSGSAGSYKGTSSSSLSIPQDNLMYKFECIENPGPGTWQLVQNIGTYLEKTYYYPFGYDTVASGSPAVYNSGVGTIGGSIGNAPYTIDGSGAWYATDPRLHIKQTAFLPTSSFPQSDAHYLMYANSIDWGNDTLQFGNVKMLDHIVYTNITASNYPWVNGQGITIEAVPFADTGSDGYGSDFKRIMFQDGCNSFYVIHSSYAGYAPPSPYSTYYNQFWETSWVFIANGSAGADQISVGDGSHTYGTSSYYDYYGLSSNTVQNFTSYYYNQGTAMPDQPIEALPADVAQYLTVGTNGVTPLVAGTPVCVYHRNNASSWGYAMGVGGNWRPFRNTSTLIPSFTIDKLNGAENALVGMQAQLTGSLTDGTYTRAVSASLNAYGLDSITISSGSVTAIKWTYDDTYALYSANAPSAGGFPPLAVGDYIYITPDAFQSANQIILGPVQQSDIIPITFKTSRQDGDTTVFWGPQLRWNNHGATKAAMDSLGQRLNLDFVAKTTFAFM